MEKKEETDLKSEGLGLLCCMITLGLWANYLLTPMTLSLLVSEMGTIESTSLWFSYTFRKECT